MPNIFSTAVKQTRRASRPLIGLAVVLVLGVAGAPMAVDAGEVVTLSGTQKAGFGSTNAKVTSAVLSLTGAATITSITATTGYYCIWSDGQSYLCGGGTRPDIVGEILPRGDYTLLPGLRDGKYSSEVHIRLEYNN